MSQALGGKQSLVAEFPDRAHMVLWASLKKRIPRRNRPVESNERTPERNERREGLSERVELGYGLELSVRLEERR